MQFVSFLAATLVVSATGFVFPDATNGMSCRHPITTSVSENSKRTYRKNTFLHVVNDLERPVTFLDDEEDESSRPREQQQKRLTKRWESLHPKLKQRLIEKGQARAIANKKKREPVRDKKRKMMMHFKKLQQEKKRASKIQRPLGFHERTPLGALIPGMEVTGLVISLTNFGAYVDVGTECDGLLHISQMSRDFFVEHPRQMVTPGDEIIVKIKSTNPEKKKLHLSLLNMDKDGDDATQNSLFDDEENDDDDDEERIQLDELQPDDELWGEINRVTDYGGYVEVGAQVTGFLHFMDHPSWEEGNHPSEFMQRGDRVRVWVSDVDMELNRLKLTANRPTHLPGPRREVF